MRKKDELNRKDTYYNLVFHHIKENKARNKRSSTNNNETSAKKATTSKYHKVQKNLIKNRTSTEGTENISNFNQDYDLLKISYENYNTELKDSSAITTHSNGFLKLIFFISTLFVILLIIASIIYIWAIKKFSTNLEQINRRLPEVNHNLLNHSILDFEALMLSVQNLGCAGMDFPRLGIPPSNVNSSSMAASLSSQRENRSIRRSTIPIMQHDLIVPSNQEPQSSLKDSNSNSGIKLKSYESQNNSNIYTPCVASNNKCPPHISRHDGEFGRDQFSSYQYNNTEIKRSYIQAPPNKSIQDVPDASSQNLQMTLCYNNHHNIHYQKPSTKNEKIKVGEKVKGFFMKIIDNTGSATSNSLKTGTEYKINNSNAYCGTMLKSNTAHNFPTTSSTTTLKMHDESTDIVNYNASTNINLHQSKFQANNIEIDKTKSSETSSQSSVSNLECNTL